jgi:multidrug resistance efflux pump
MRLKLGLSALSLGMIALATMHTLYAQRTPPPSGPVVEPVHSPFDRCIAGAGLVEAQTENIAIGSPHAGVVVGVLVRADQRVAVGTPLFRLDDRHLQAELKVRRASVAVARARVAQLEQEPRREQVPIKEARVREAQATLAKHEDLIQRARRLYSARAVNDEELVQHQQGCQVARAQLAQAEAELELLRAGAWEPDKAMARAQLAEAETLAAQTETELERLTVRAPISGQVLKVNLRVGEYVNNAREQSALLVMGDLEHLHVRVDVDEADIPRLDSAARARGYLRGRPGEAYDLTFVRVEPEVIVKKSLTGSPKEREDTRVLQVIYRVEHRDRRSYVGQQMDIFIEVPSGR